MQPSRRREEETECRQQNPRGPERGRLPEEGTEEAYLKGEETGRGTGTGEVKHWGSELNSSNKTTQGATGRQGTFRTLLVTVMPKLR